VVSGAEVHRGTGKLAGVKVGRVWRIRPEDVEEYLRTYSNRKAGKA
jgi:hypothetical protein